MNESTDESAEVMQETACVRSRQRALIAGLTGLIGPVVAWHALAGVPCWDSMIFESCGWFITVGLVPYRDFWDHKPPGIHLLNAAAVCVGGGSGVAVKVLQLVNAFFLAAAFAARAMGSGCRPLATVGGTMLMALTFFASGTYQGGNRVEEFGASFVLIGLALRQRVSPVIGTEGRIFLLGVVCLGCAPLLKEPFVLSIAPWVVNDLWGRWVSGGDRMRAIVAYAAALTCPAVIVITWLALTGGLGGWFDALAYNLFAYGEKAGVATTLLSNALPFLKHTTGDPAVTVPVFVVGILAGLAGFTGWRRSVVPALIAQLGCEFIATAVGGRHTETYYLQSIPTFMLVVTLGIDAIARASWLPVGRAAVMARSGAATALIAVACARPVAARVQEFRAGAGWWPGNTVMADVITELTEPHARIWCPAVYRTDVYSLAHRLPATRYFYIPGAGQGMNAPLWAGLAGPHAGGVASRGEQMEAEVRESLPQVIVLDSFAICSLDIAAPSLLQWIERYYAPLRRFPPINGHTPILLVPRERLNR